MSPRHDCWEAVIITRTNQAGHWSYLATAKASNTPDCVFEAPKPKAPASNISGGGHGKKDKNKKKNNELKALAFGL